MLHFAAKLSGGEFPVALEITPPRTLRLDVLLRRAHDVKVQGNYAYVASKGDGPATSPGRNGCFTVVDLSEALRPRIVGGVCDLDNAEAVAPYGTPASSAAPPGSR